MNKLIIDLDIYSQQNIDKVKDLYKDLATIDEEISNNKMLLTFNHCRLNTERTIKEFENYLIGLENTNAGI